MGTALLPNIRLGSRQLVFLDTLQMGNTGLSYTIALNLNDGAGWRSVTPDIPINVTFDSLGTKYFTIRFTDNSSREWYAKTRVEIIEDTNEDESESFRTEGYSDAPDATISTIPGVQLDIFFGNECNKLLKPFIFIEGFNPGLLLDQKFGEMILRLNSTPYQGNVITTPTGNTTWQNLHDSGYDVVYVDFADGAADIFANGDIVRDVIEFVNAQKAINSSEEKNIVLGASMGGLCGFWALGKMEAENEDHQVSKFITFDTPFRGANVPIGLQLLVKHFHDYEIAFGRMLRDEKPFLITAKEVFNLPATKQLLYFNAWNPAKNGFSTWRNDFYSQLYTVSVIKAEHVAISNGSGIGEGQLMSCGGLYLDLPYQTGGDFLGTFTINKAKTYLAVDFDDEQVLYEYSFYKRVAVFLGFKWEWGEFDGYNIPSVDCAPGGVTDFSIGALFSATLGNGANVTQLFPQPNKAAFCFVPTISSQNIADQSNFFLTFSEGTCTNTAITDCIQSRSNAYTSPYAGIAAHNQNHVVLTSNLATYLLNDFYNPPLSSPINSFTYNFGKREPDETVNPALLAFTSTTNIISKNILVTNTGKLWINKLDRLARTDVTSNPFNDEDQDFHVFLTKDCNGDPVTLTVESGGELKLGEVDDPIVNKGFLYVMDEASIIMEDGGIADLSDLSELIVEDNGIVDIKEGGLISTNFGSSISLEDGSVMIVRSGGTLRLSHYSSLAIESGGKLVFEDGAILQLWDAPAVDGEARVIVKGELEIQGEIDFDGNGYFDFYPSNVLNLSNGILTLKGDDKASRLIRLSDGAILNLQDALVEISSGRIVYHGQAEITSEDAGLKFTDVHFEGYTNRTIGLTAYDPYRFQLDGCSFNNHGFAVSVEGVSGAALTSGISIEDCTIEDNEIGLILSSVPLTIMSHSDIQNGVGSTPTGLIALDCGEIRLEHTNFDGFDYAAIETRQSTLLHLFNTSISHSLFGILDGDGSGTLPPAIYLMDGSIISSCDRGIHMVGNEYQGLVFMDCASLWENETGVHGSDITLAIDAKSHALATDGTIRPNSFKRNSGGMYFDICYKDKWQDIGYNFTATNNYWHEDPSSNSSTGEYWVRKPSTSGSTNCSSSTIPVQMLYTPKETTLPTICVARTIIVHEPDRTISFSFADKDCTQTAYLDTNDIVGVYSAGLSSFLTGAFDNAEAFLGKVAGSAIDTTSVVCADYIRTARAIYPPSVLERPISNQNNVISSVDFEDDKWIIRPVPFDDNLMITSKFTSGKAQILDLQGRVVESFEIEQSGKTIDVKSQDWSPGIYFVKIITSAGETITRKILKNK